MADVYVVIIGILTLVGTLATFYTLIENVLDWQALKKTGANGGARVLVKGGLIGDTLALLTELALLGVLAISVFVPRPFPPMLRSLTVVGLTLAVVLIAIGRVAALVTRVKQTGTRKEIRG